MSQYRLFVDSDNGVDVDPLWSFKEESQKIESKHRVRSGKSYIYKWGNYNRFKIPVTFVSSSFKAIVNSYWQSNAEVLFMEVGVPSSVSSVRVVNKKTPVGKFMVPYVDQFAGVIELETY